MKQISLVVPKYLQDNRIFDTNLHRDNCFARFTLLKSMFAELGYDLSTNDIHGLDRSQFVIYASNMPKKLPALSDAYKSFLILSESAFIRPENYDQNNHRNFNKIFTWSDELVDDKKYIKLNYSHDFPSSIEKNIAKKTKLCAMIAGNKRPQRTLKPELKALDLYMEREKAIRWFEVNQPSRFDLYGVGWDKFEFQGPKFVRALNLVPYIPTLTQRLLRQSYPSYRGRVAHKVPVLQKYRFSICYENAKNIPGYITEKIFDSFFAGCIPIYWGANNIDKYVPKECFIDKRDFPTYDELFKYISTMSGKTIGEYLESIEKYLRSDDSEQFTSTYFANTIIKSIVGTR